MSDKELNRVNVIQAVCEKRLRRRDAAAQLELTERQVQRLINRYRESGAAGLAHGHRGKPGNHCLPDSFKLHERSRSKSMPKRRAQVRIQEQLRAVNPVLTNPDEFRASLRK